LGRPQVLSVKLAKFGTLLLAGRRRCDRVTPANYNRKLAKY